VTSPGPPVRDAFRPLGVPRSSADSATPDADLIEGMRQIIATWNRCIPRNRVRAFAQHRYESLRGVLYAYTADEVCGAIEHYGAQTFQRQNNAWKRFDNWIAIDVVTLWVEDAAEHRDRVEAARLARRAADPAVAGLYRARDAQAEAAAAAKAVTDARIAAFRALPEPRRRELLAAAMKKIPAGLRDRERMVLMQAVVLMEEEHDDG